jgi:cytochrome c biogenesis protein
LLDSNGIELKRKTIFVNEPLVYKGVTIYQTDWDILGLKLQLNNGNVFQIPLKKFKDKGVWVGSVIYGDKDKKITVLLKDLGGTVFVYDGERNIIGENKIGSKIQLDEKTSLKIVDFVNGTGLQIKEDQSLKIVYLSFLFIMISVYISFLSYGQIWGIESDDKYLIGGKTNRAVLNFQENLKKITSASNQNAI